MTEAVSAKGTRLAVKIDGVWTYIPEVKSIPEVGETPATLDATHLTSEAHEYIEDIPDIGDSLEFTCNGTKSLLTLLGTMSRNGTYDWRITYAQLGKTVGFTGTFKYRMGGAEVSTVQDIIISVTPRTNFVFTDITSTYLVTYDANGGDGTMEDSATYSNGDTVTVMQNTFTRDGYTWANWNTVSDNSGVSYDGSDTFTIYEDTTLYAIWADNGEGSD